MEKKTVLFKPREVLEAGRWLSQGNPRQAAYALLACRDPHHRDVVAWKDKVARELLSIARHEYAGGALWVSWEALQLAKQLMPLNGEDATFAEKVERTCQREKARRDLLDAVKQQAQHRLNNHQYESALDLVKRCLEWLTGNFKATAQIQLWDVFEAAQKGLSKQRQLLREVEQHLERGELGEARRRLVELESYLAHDDYRYLAWSLRLYLAEARQALADRDLPRALACWRQASQLDETDPEVRQFARDLVQVERQFHNQNICKRITQQSDRVSVRGEWLVVSAPEIVLGSHPDATVRLLAPVHSLHARIWREHGQYRILPCTNKRNEFCPVWVNHRRIGDVHQLQHGEIIALGQDLERGVTFRFHQPLASSGTAVLVATPASVRRIHAVAPSQPCSHVILLDDWVTFSPDPRSGHVLWSDAPSQFRLVWSKGGLYWEAIGGVVRMEVGEQFMELRNGPVYVPSSFTLSVHEDTNRSEAEWLKNQILNRCPNRDFLRIDFGPA